MNKLVSVIIPTYKRPKYLLRAINSVLSQSYSNIEIIVVDDNGLGTEDQISTHELLNDYILNGSIIYIPHERNMNGAAARNTGVAYSHGEYIAFLDDDDEFVSTKIEKQVYLLNSLDNKWGGCYCNVDFICRNKVVRTDYNDVGSFAEKILLLQNGVGTSTLLLRKEVFCELGGFDVTFQRHQDWEFLIRYFRCFKMALVSGVPLLKYYVSDSLVNRPKDLKIIEIKNKFLRAFETDIMSFDSSAEIYSAHWLEASSILLKYGYLKSGLECALKANKYKKISLTKMIFLFKSVVKYIIKRD